MLFSLKFDVADCSDFTRQSSVSRHETMTQPSRKKKRIDDRDDKVFLLANIWIRETFSSFSSLSLHSMFKRILHIGGNRKFCRFRGRVLKAKTLIVPLKSSVSGCSKAHLFTEAFDCLFLKHSRMGNLGMLQIESIFYSNFAPLLAADLTDFIIYLPNMQYQRIQWKI